MKIRIKGNSIRIRLSKTEVDNFALQGYLEERTQFIDNALIYALEASNTVSELSAKINGAKITVQVPLLIANNWTSTEQVGFENKMSLGNEQSLFLLVEKDFVCLDNTFEDQSDMFPNPNAVC
ncbi:MAG: hypothetical protein V4643_00060 [Bacteroidota bacterium]